MALKQAKIDPTKIDYINAHATSTPIGDGTEAQAILEVLGGKSTCKFYQIIDGPMSVGWLGASEIVYSLLMMQNDFIAPNIKF